ncbi:MAG: hypothetical protein K8S20_04710 [Chloroflexi bacterium]|nr:hypothetical protein [Chloroflexota bacterium]
MELLNIFALIGLFIDDILATFSIVGSAVLFIAAIISKKPMKKFGQVADWSILGLAFGGFGQIAIAVTRTPAEKIGFLQLPLLIVNGLLFISLLMVVGRFILMRIPR